MILNKQVRPDRPTGPPNLEDSHLALSLPDLVTETLFAHEEKTRKTSPWLHSYFEDWAEA